jgi:hypothetical protein
MRTLKVIASEIQKDWPVINNAGARDALECMKKMGVVTAQFGADPNGYGVIGAFLTNAIGWRGEVARRIKKELRSICGQKR